MSLRRAERTVVLHCSFESSEKQLSYVVLPSSRCWALLTGRPCDPHVQGEVWGTAPLSMLVIPKCRTFCIIIHLWTTGRRLLRITISQLNSNLCGESGDILGLKYWKSHCKCFHQNRASCHSGFQAGISAERCHSLKQRKLVGFLQRHLRFDQKLPQFRCFTGRLAKVHHVTVSFEGNSTGRDPR